MKMADSTAPGPSASSNHQQGIDHSLQDYIETSQMLAILCIDTTKFVRIIGW